ncbi:MAG: M24 family metallopeptidase [Gemmatimonadales bacterium]|nr:M24 family metallopeptidase [Gemmatimonadales bacterium]
MGERRLDRQAAVRGALAGEDAASLLVTHLPNIRWLTGFTGSAGLLLLTPARTVLVTDFRYASQAPQEASAVAEVVIERSNLWDRMRRAIAADGIASIGFESHSVTVRDAGRIAALVPGRAIPRAGVVERLRERKDDDEVAAIRAAAALAHAALGEILPTIRVGERELDVAARLEHALRRRGSEWHPFQTIVAAGERSALPHARTSERVIARGELLLIDFGAQVDGYCADITRTAVVGGPPDGRQVEVHGAVQAAQRHARERIRAGMSGRDADALARDLLVAAGYGDAFGHSLGHGLGLEVHEAPRLAATAEAPIIAGAVVTVEPGIYLPGWGGVRLEDDVWIAPDGPVLLSDGNTDLLILDS